MTCYIVSLFPYGGEKGERAFSRKASPFQKCKCFVSSSSRRRPSNCLNTTLLKNKEYFLQLKPKLEEFINLDKESASDLSLVWSAIKGFIRNNAISFSSHLKKSKMQAIFQLEKACTELERDLLSNYSNEVELKLKTGQT